MFRVKGLGLRVQGLWYGIETLGLQGSGLKVDGVEFRHKDEGMAE